MKNENAGVQKQFFFRGNDQRAPKKLQNRPCYKAVCFSWLWKVGSQRRWLFFFGGEFCPQRQCPRCPLRPKNQKKSETSSLEKIDAKRTSGAIFLTSGGWGLFPQSLDLGFRVPGSKSDVNLVFKLYGFKPKTKSQIKRGRTKKRVKSRRWRVESSCSTLYKKTTKDYGTLLGSAGHLLEKPFFLITRCHHYFVGEARKNERKKRRKAESKKRNKRRNKKKEHMKKQEKRNGMFYTQIFLENLGPCLLNYPLALGHVRPWCGKKISESRVWAPFWSRCGQNSALSAFFCRTRPPSDKSQRID